MAGKRLIYYGLQRSGTNFLAKIIEQHFDIEFLNKTGDRRHPGHKHFRIYDNKALIGRENYHNDLHVKNLQDLENKLEIEEEIDGIIIISKDPYSWLISYQKWAKSMKWPKPPHPFILEYNEFYRKWWELSIGMDRIMFMRYSDLLLNSEETLEDLSVRFNLDRLYPEKREVENIRKVPRSSKFTGKNLEYYSKQKYLKKYSKTGLMDINQLIDHDLIKKLGYKSYF